MIDPNDMHGAHYVHYSEAWEAVFVWHGGHTVNVYSAHDGSEFHAFSVGNWETGETTRGDVREGIADTIETWEEEAEPLTEPV